MFIRFFSFLLITATISCDSAKFAGKTAPTKLDPETSVNATGVEPDDNLQHVFEAGNVGEDGKFEIDEVLPSVPVVPGSVKIKIGDEIVAVDDKGNIIYDEITSDDPSSHRQPDLTDLDKQKMISGKIDYKTGDIKAKGDNIQWKNKPIKILYETLKPGSDKEIEEVILSNVKDVPEGSSDNISSSNTGASNNANDSIDAGANPIRSTSKDGQSCSVQFSASEVVRSEFKQDLNREDTTVSCQNSSTQTVQGISINFRALNKGSGNLEMQCSRSSPPELLAPTSERTLKCDNQENCGHYCGGNEYLVYTHVNFRGLNAGTGNLYVKCVTADPNKVSFGASRHQKQLDTEFAGLSCAADEIVTGVSVNFRGLNAGEGNLEMRCTKVIQNSCN